MTVWDSVDDLTEQFDATAKIEGGSGCAWSAEIRLTLTNPEEAPSRSIAFWTTGHAGPEQAVTALLDDVKTWLPPRGGGGPPRPAPRRGGEGRDRPPQERRPRPAN